MNLPYGPPRIENCSRRKLRSDDFFCTFPKESWEAFNQIKHVVVLPEGAIVFVKGQASRGVFMRGQGRAKVSASSRCGKAFILRIESRKTFLGLNAVGRTSFGCYWSTAMPVCTQRNRSAVTVRTPTSGPLERVAPFNLRKGSYNGG